MTAMPSVLACGGAGYIGSHMSKCLAQVGYLPVTFGDLSTVHRHAVRWAPLKQEDLLDKSALREVPPRHEFSIVAHFAAHSVAAHLVRDPAARVASAAKTTNELGWRLHLGLYASLQSALRWQQRISKP